MNSAPKARKIQSQRLVSSGDIAIILMAMFSVVGIPRAVLAADGCTEVPGIVTFQGLEVVPARPEVGETVELRFDVGFQVYGIGALALQGAAPLLEGNTLLAGTREVRFPLTAVQAGRTSVTLDVTYHTEELCGPIGYGFYRPGPDHTVSSPAYVVEIAQPPVLPFACVGDCDANGSVDVDEVVTVVNIALGDMEASACSAGDADHSGTITVDEIIAAVDKGLLGCPAELEIGHCYEQVSCAPLPFETVRSRGSCCRLARSLTGLPFSWCSASAIDPSSGLCTDCTAYPCEGFPPSVGSRQ
jgi:hypothetical protein